MRLAKGRLGAYARAALLARAVLTERPYRSVERTARTAPPLDAVRLLVLAFGTWRTAHRWTPEALVAWAAAS